MATVVIGAFAHNGTSFLWANAGTPTGKSGVSAHNGTAFQDAIVVSAYNVAMWNTAWAISGGRS